MNKVKWVSVEESYPEEGVDVLVILQDMRMLVAYTDCNRWLTYIDRYNCLIDEPTHWAYLPEPPSSSVQKCTEGAMKNGRNNDR